MTPVTDLFWRLGYALSMGRSHRHFQKRHESMEKEIRRFYEILSRLRYEGKARLGGNVKELWHTADFLKKNLETLVRYEEKFLFPFLKIHVPRLGPLLHLLKSEHRDFKRHFGDFENTLVALKKARLSAARPGLIHRLKEDGTYLVCLLRSHLWVEGKDVYSVVNKELKPIEQRRLSRLPC